MVSEGGGPHLGMQQVSWAQVGGRGQTPSTPPPAPLVLVGPSHLTFLFSPMPSSLLCPQDQPGPEGTSEGIGPSPRARHTPLADWGGEMLGTLPPDLYLLGYLQVWEPLPPFSHPSGALVLSGLHFSSPFSTLTSYQFTWVFILSPWVSGSPTSILQVP